MGLKKNAEEVSSETEINEEIETTETPETPGVEDAAGDDQGNEGGEEAAVEIDGIKFKSEKDALEWALENKNKLEHERAIAEAYRTGIQDAVSRGESPAQVTPPQKPEIEITEEEFYQNPVEALKKVKDTAKEEAKKELSQSAAQREAERQVWEEFSGLHPDLADFKTDVELVANSPEHLPVIQALVRTKGQKAAYDYVAQKTRAKFQAYVEATKQKVVLPRGSGAGPTPTGAGKSVTPPKKEEKVLSMREQLRQHKAKFIRK